MWTPNKLTVNIDTRENFPVLFPEYLEWYPSRRSTSPVHIPVDRRKVRLLVGDYRLAEFPKCCIIERKASASELTKNLLSTDHGRFSAAFQRLVDGCRYPYLLIDDNISRITLPSEHAHPAAALDALFRLCATSGVRLLWVGNARTRKARRLLGATLLRLMLAHAVADRAPKKIS